MSQNQPACLQISDTCRYIRNEILFIGKTTSIITVHWLPKGMKLAATNSQSYEHFKEKFDNAISHPGMERLII